MGLSAGSDITGKLDKLFRFQPKAKPRVKLEKKDHESHQKHALRKALDDDTRRWERYLEARAHRMKRLETEYENVRRWVSFLARMADRVTCFSRRDCDVDIADVARRLRLEKVGGPYDRFLLFEFTSAWLSELAKRQRVWRLDDGSPYFVARPPETLDDLKLALELR